MLWSSHACLSKVLAADHRRLFLPYPLLTIQFPPTHQGDTRGFFIYNWVPCSHSNAFLSCAVCKWFCLLARDHAWLIQCSIFCYCTIQCICMMNCTTSWLLLNLLSSCKMRLIILKLLINSYQGILHVYFSFILLLWKPSIHKLTCRIVCYMH